MYTQPSIQDVIRSVMIWLQRDLANEKLSSRAQMDLQVALTVLQWAVQRIESEPQLLAREHNEMVALYRGLAALMPDEPGARGRIRVRSEELGSGNDLPIPPVAADVGAAHHRLSEGLIDTLSDLDELVRAGDEQASAALALVRRHLLSRSIRDFQNLMVNPNAMPGRD